jgi:hypothetical protein
MCALSEVPSISAKNKTHGIQTRHVIIATTEHNSIIQPKPAFYVRPCETVKDMLAAVAASKVTNYSERKSMCDWLMECWNDRGTGTRRNDILVIDLKQVSITFSQDQTQIDNNQSGARFPY